MGRIVFAEERHFDYLNSLGSPDGYSVGLVLGQSTAQKDFVVHLARTLPAANIDVIEESLLVSPMNGSESTANNYMKSIKDLDLNLVADHAKHVTRMLPGGMWVLGIFIVGPGDCFNDSNCISKIRSVLTAIQRNLASNVYLYGNSNQENLILSYNSSTDQYVCKSTDANTGGILKPADWKFQKKATKWHQLEALVDLDHIFPILDGASHTLKRQLQDIVKNISDMISSSLIIIEGESRSSEDLIEAIGKKKRTKKVRSEEEEEKILQVGVYLPCTHKEKKGTVRIVSCSASMRLMGQLVSRIVLHQKASINEATNAMKQDILRSLASRLELHWDSVIEEENGSPEENITLHEPPRRVLVELPQSKVTLSDYLFPGEGPQESLILLKELLDLEVSENQIQKDVERQVDPAEFYSQNEVKTVPVDLGKETVSNNHVTAYIAVIVMAIIIALFGILVNELYSVKGS
ncbi:protein odr-4 homolog [Phymastichus coffea]|uniref:protein odr-4 homolog n=1 Tax=Phymastichus coffea TaxID=108790 RepID=UPI00273C7110|nr:protein odr-4 homolog [Phymastichus coffea]